MQCPNCQFENLPGMAHCVRCQSMLALGTVAVAPPRASAWKLGTRWARIMYTCRSLGQRFWKLRPRWSGMTRTRPPWAALAWSLIPGAGFIRSGRRLAGWCTAAAWVGLMLGFLLALGLSAAFWFLMLAVFLHTVSILALLAAELAYHHVLTRALFGIVLFTGLRFLLYEPMCALGRAFYVPVLVSGMTLGTIIQDGDALMYQGRWTRPDRFQRGSIVVYRIHGMRRAGVILRDGIGVDRIVGEPGDLVELRQGVLFVNNEPLTEAMQPLGRSNIMLPEQARVLGHGEYLIFPSRLNLAVHGNVQAAPLVGRVSCVRAENILGRVVFRLHPWSGFGAVQDGIS